MLVSVIIPTFNRINVIGRAIDSVLSQSVESEIIVIDDGSTDGTEEYLTKNYPTIRLISQKNQGASVARNTGIKNAQCKYIAFLDSDDQWCDKKLEKQISIMETDDNIFLTFTDLCEIINKKIKYKSVLKEGGYLKVASGKIYENLLLECFIFTSTVLIRREIFEDVGMFDASLKVCEDIDLWLRIALKGKIEFIDGILVNHYRLGDNLTCDNLLYGYSNLQMLKKQKILISKIYPCKEKYIEIINENICKASLAFAYHLIKNGNSRKARQVLIENLNFYKFLNNIKLFLKSYI